MVKKTPGYVLVGSQSFSTKKEAEEFAIEQRRTKGQQGYKTRYELDMDPTSGQFRVRVFVYVTDSKGKLI